MWRSRQLSLDEQETLMNRLHEYAPLAGDTPFTFDTLQKTWCGLKYITRSNDSGEYIECDLGYTMHDTWRKT